MQRETPGKKGKVFAMRDGIRKILGKDSKQFGNIRSESDIHQLLLTLQESDGERYDLLTQELKKAGVNGNPVDRRGDDTRDNEMSSKKRKRKKHQEHEELLADTMALFGMPACEDYYDNVKKLCDIVHAMIDAHED